VTAEVCATGAQTPSPSGGPPDASLFGKVTEESPAQVLVMILRLRVLGRIEVEVLKHHRLSPRQMAIQGSGAKAADQRHEALPLSIDRLHRNFPLVIVLDVVRPVVEVEERPLGRIMG
jgi:hypothetical protein